MKPTSTIALQIGVNFLGSLGIEDMVIYNKKPSVQRAP
jgi:hypothetical protein